MAGPSADFDTLHAAWEQTSGAVQRGLGFRQNSEDRFERHVFAQEHLLHRLVIGADSVDPCRRRHQAERTGDCCSVVGPVGGKETGFVEAHPLQRVEATSRSLCGCMPPQRREVRIMPGIVERQFIFDSGAN